MERVIGWMIGWGIMIGAIMLLGRGCDHSAHNQNSDISILHEEASAEYEGIDNQEEVEDETPISPEEKLYLLTGERMEEVAHPR